MNRVANIEVKFPIPSDSDDAWDFGELLIGHVNYQTLSVAHAHGVKFELVDVIADDLSISLHLDGTKAFIDLKSENRFWQFMEIVFPSLEESVRYGTAMRNDGTSCIEGVADWDDFWEKPFDVIFRDEKGSITDVLRVEDGIYEYVDPEEGVEEAAEHEEVAATEEAAVTETEADQEAPTRVTQLLFKNPGEFPREGFAELVVEHLNYQTLSVAHVHGVEFTLVKKFESDPSLIVFNIEGVEQFMEAVDGDSDRFWRFLNRFIENLEETIVLGSPQRLDGTRKIEGTERYKNVFSNANMELSDTSTVEAEEAQLSETDTVKALREAYEAAEQRIEKQHRKALSKLREDYVLRESILLERLDQMETETKRLRKLLRLKKSA